jgi:hypothetical protein
LGSTLRRQRYGAVQGTGRHPSHPLNSFITYFLQFLVYKAKYEATQMKKSLPTSTVGHSGFIILHVGFGN